MSQKMGVEDFSDGRVWYGLANKVVWASNTMVVEINVQYSNIGQSSGMNILPTFYKGTLHGWNIFYI